MLRFLHCADLHLDSPFAGLTPEQAAARRTLQREMPRQIVSLASDHHCQLILCSGDVFDNRQVCPETLQALRDALEACPCPVLIAPGNHDPYGDTSPWTAVRWPEQVHLFRAPWESVEFPELGCRVWGAGFTAAECYDPLPAVPEDRLLQLAVLHGDLKPGPYRYLSKEAIEASHLDYLALGHIHKTQLPQKLGGTWVGWPGIPMGRGFDETGIHGVFLVDLDQNSCRTELLPLPGPRYEDLTVRAGEAPELPEDTSDWICRLTLTGEAEPFQPETLRQKLAPRFYALELRDRTVPPRSLWEEAGSDTLRGRALAALKLQYDQADEDRRQTVALAARYLLAALEGREQP